MYMTNKWGASDVSKAMVNAVCNGHAKTGEMCQRWDAGLAAERGHVKLCLDPDEVMRLARPREVVSRRVGRFRFR